MAVKVIEIPELGTVQLQKRKGSRSMRLTLNQEGVARVTMPHWVPYQAGITFAKSKRAWINLQRSRIQTAPLADGQAIGKAHHIRFQTEPGIVRPTSRVKATEVVITHSQYVASSDPAVQRAARAAIIRALRNEAEALLPQRLQQLAQQGGFRYRSVQIKQLKRRWGSCNHEQEIVLNLFLMQLPWYLIDYVLWHELTHTQHLNHGTQFWETLCMHVPNAKSLRKEIHTHRTMIS